MLNISFQLPIRFFRGGNVLTRVDRLYDQLDMIREGMVEQDARLTTLENAAQPVQPINFLSASPTTCEHCQLPLGIEPTMADTMGQTYHRECAEKLIANYGGTT